MKYIKLFLLLLTTTLSGCQPSAPNKGTDGYKFEEAEMVATKFSVTVVLANSLEEINALYFEKTNKQMPQGVKLIAFSVFNPAKPDRCTVYMLDPRIKYQPDFIGHEFTHCIFGNWHKKEDKRRGQH